MNCLNCNATLPGKVKFCPGCGQPQTLGRSGRIQFFNFSKPLMGVAAGIAFAVSIGAYFIFDVNPLTTLNSENSSNEMAFGRELFPVAQDGKCGYINSRGEWAINPQFDRASLFTEKNDQAIVGLAGRYGVIGSSGKFAVNPIYGSISMLPDGSGYIVAKDGKYGTIDINGLEIIAPKYDMINGVDKSGRLYVITGQQSPLHGIADASGNYLLKPQFQSIGYDFDHETGISQFVANGVVGVKNLDGSSGVATLEGKVTSFPQKIALSMFSRDGLAMFSNNGLAPALIGLGEAQTNPENAEIPALWGYVDLEGNVAINPQFSAAYGFSGNGLASVSIGEGDLQKYGFIDKKGKYVINPQYTGTLEFKKRANGWTALALLGDKWGVINEAGKFVISPIFGGLRDVRSGSAFIAQYGANYGLLDFSGKWIVAPDYKSFEPAFGDQWVVQKNNSLGVVNSDGDYTVSTQYQHCVRIDRFTGFDVLP